MLITFEGVDGSGKSTQARLLVERLQRQGIDPLYVREPGGTDVSERIRTLLLDPALAIVSYAELLLFSAARAQLVAERIQPRLGAGGIVICDRFYDSTIAYQGAGRQVEDPEWLHDFQRRVTGGLVPDRTYFVALDPAAGRQRLQHRAADRMEIAEAAFYERVAEAYEHLAANEPRFMRLDGFLSIEALHEQIWHDLTALLNERSGTRLLG